MLPRLSLYLMIISTLIYNTTQVRPELLLLGYSAGMVGPPQKLSVKSSLELCSPPEAQEAPAVTTWSWEPLASSASSSQLSRRFSEEPLLLLNLANISLQAFSLF